MLLRLNERLTALRDDRGSALVAVVGVLVVTLIVTVVISASVISAMGFTTATRANVQSQAAAEAGIAVVQASLIAGTCAADADTIEDIDGDGYLEAVFRGTNPEYTTVVKSWSGASPENGCPTVAATRVVASGLGTAATPGLLSYGDSTLVEAEFVSPAEAPEISASGAAVYAYSSTGFTGGGTLISYNGSEPNVQVREGNVTCDGGTNGAQDFIVANGTLTVTGGCVLMGNAWSSEHVKTNGGSTVPGNVVAPTVTVDGGSNVYGSVWADNTFYLQGGARVHGSAVARDLAGTNGDIGGDAWIKNHATLTWSFGIGGTLYAKSMTKPTHMNVNAQISPNPPTGPAKPVMPVVPDWYDFGFDPADWSGFQVATLSGNCELVWWPYKDPFQDAIDSFNGSPGVIDARGCTNGLHFSGGRHLELEGDVAIIANKFTMTSGGSFTSDDNVRLWLITPDETADQKPTCTGPNVTAEGGFTVTGISSILYTPCKVQLTGGINWRGQVFAGQVGVSGGSKITYDPVGLPGVDLSTGLPTGSGGGSESFFDAPQTVRNVNR